MLSFHWPICVLLLLLPWLINRLVEKKLPDNNWPTLYFPRIEKLQLAINTVSKAVQIPKVIHVLWHIFWLLLVLTAMRPELVKQPELTSQYGYDVMLTVDLSKSMGALDFAKSGSRITRLQAVKDVVAKFVEQRQGDRLGLIVFAAAAYPYVPLTYDLASVSQQLQQLTLGMAGDYTAIGDAIGLAIKSLQHRKGERILILLTDGADNASKIPPLQAAKLAAKHNIKIYTIGMGTNGMVPIRDDDGNLVMFNGVLDEALLIDIAKVTGGIYSRATNKTKLEAIYQQINKLEQHESASKVVMIRSSLHYFPLGAALIILLGLLILYRRYSYAIQ